MLGETPRPPMIAPGILCLNVPLLVAAAPATPGPHLPPVDEAAKDPSLLQFRDHLLDIIRRRDAKALVALIREDALMGFDGSCGPQDFIAWWHPEQADSRVWLELSAILRLGGAFRPNGNFEAPYVSATWPEDIDAFEYIAITGKGIPCHPRPDDRARPVQHFSYDIVRNGWEVSSHQAVERLRKRGWTMVQRANGQTGYVRSRFVRGACDQRIVFSRSVQGTWSISAFVAGD